MKGLNPNTNPERNEKQAEIKKMQSKHRFIVVHPLLERYIHSMLFIPQPLRFIYIALEARGT